MAVTPHKKYATQGGEHTRGLSFMKPGRFGHQGKRGPQTADTTKARGEFPDSPQQGVFIFAGSPSTTFVSANAGSGYCPDEQEQLRDPHGLQPFSEGIIKFVYLPECGGVQTIDAFGNRNIDRCCDDNKLGPCKYRFLVNPHSSFKNIEYGETILDETIRKQIIVSAIKKGYTDETGKYLHYVYKDRVGGQHQIPYNHTIAYDAKWLCDKCQELLPIGRRILRPKHTCWGTGIYNINNWEWPGGWEDDYWLWIVSSKLGQCLKCLHNHIYTPEHFPRDFVKTPCYNRDNSRVGGNRIDVFDAKTGNQSGVEWGDPPDFDQHPTTAGSGLLGKVNIVVRKKYGCDQDRFYYVKITDVTHQEPSPSLDIGESVTISYCWARNTDLTLETPCGEFDEDDNPNEKMPLPELEWSGKQYVTITDKDMLEKPCYHEVHLECSDDTTDSLDEDTGWYGCHGPATDLFTPENVAQPPPSYRNPTKPCSGVKILFYGPFKDWVGDGALEVTPDAGASCEDDDNYLYGPWWVRAKRVGGWVPDENNDKRCKCDLNQHPLGCNACGCPTNPWSTGPWFGHRSFGCDVCSQPCCRFKGFPSDPPDNLDSDGWDSVVPNHGKLEKVACVCLSDDALATDCGCDDVAPPENLSSFSAKEMKDMNRIILNWSFPKRKAGEYVIIQWKLGASAPTGPANGNSITDPPIRADGRFYEVETYTHGTGNTNDLFTDQQYFYRAFTVDAAGNINPDGLEATATTDPPPGP